MKRLANRRLWVKYNIFMVIIPLFLAMAPVHGPHLSYVPTSIVWAADTPETVCNGVDDDGDGVIDDGFDVGANCTAYAYNGCKQQGVKKCSDDGAGTVCVAKETPPVKGEEKLGTPSCFDGYDNDCDGFTDWDDPGCKTTNEVGLCNELDDDHDGLTDEDFPDLGKPCTVGVGFCARAGTIVCSPDGKTTVCSAIAGSPSSENTPGKGNCIDGIDNDCDGLTDVADPGCQSGELCDGLDNDGDGLVDEDFPLLGTPCSAGTGPCQSQGIYVCAPDKTQMVCYAVPLLAGSEGPDEVTCSDGIDNDCDGLIDGADPDCASAGITVSCALVPARVTSGEMPVNACAGQYEIWYSTNATTGIVVAELLALDEEGNTLGSIPVEDGDLAYLVSRPHSKNFVVKDSGTYFVVVAPVPMLRITVDTGQRVVQAFSSPIPYLGVIKPSGKVVSASEGDVTDVVVAIPLVDPETLSVMVDGVDILAGLGIEPINDFPGGPFQGTVSINEQQVTVTGLVVQFSPLGTIGTNTLTMKLENLGGGGHVLEVHGRPIQGSLRSIGGQCYVDDIRDAKTVAVFEIKIISPGPGEKTDVVPITVNGEIRHGRRIDNAKVQGLPIDVSLQFFTPGDGVTSADKYVLPFTVVLPRSDLSGNPQTGTFDPGQNDLIVGAEDDQGNMTYATQRFTLGGTIAPQGVMVPQALQAQLKSVVQREVEQAVKDLSSSPLNLENAVVFGISKDGIGKFFQSTCDKALAQVQAKIDEALKNASYPTIKPAVDGACDPTVRFNTASVDFEGTLNCEVTPEEGQVAISIALPKVIAQISATGSCRDETPGVCWSEVIVNGTIRAVFEGMQLGFAITEELAREGGESPATFDPGTVTITVPYSDVEINCIAGVVFDAIDFLTFGTVDVENIASDVIEEKINVSIDLAEVLRSKGQDPLEVQKIALNEENISSTSKLTFNQDLVNVEITPEGLTGTLSASFEVVTPDPEIGDTPEVPLTPAAPPVVPLSGAGEVFIVVSDDTFSLLFAGMTAQGLLKTDCVASGSTFLNLLPVDCDALQGNARARCHGAKGDMDCSLFSTSGQQQACNDAHAALASRNITVDTPLLFCTRRGISPRLLINDDIATPEAVEARLHMNDLRVWVLLDRATDGVLTGEFSQTRPCLAADADNTADCKWGAACFDFDIGTSLTLGTSAEGDPQIVPAIGDLIGSPLAVDCQAPVNYGTVNFWEVGARDPVNLIADNIKLLLPLFQADGLSLGGFVKFTGTQKLFALETATDPACLSCQEYIGITGDIEPQP